MHRKHHQQLKRVQQKSLYSEERMNTLKSTFGNGIHLKGNQFKTKGLNERCKEENLQEIIYCLMMTMH